MKHNRYLLTATALLTSILSQAVTVKKVVSDINLPDSSLREYGDFNLDPDEIDMMLNQPIHVNNLLENIVFTFLITLLTFAFIIGIIWIVLHYRNARERERLRLLERSLSHETPLPPEFFSTVNGRPAERELQSGIIWIGAGLAICLFFLLVAFSVWPIGLLPLFIGISHVAVYMARKNASNAFKQRALPRHTDVRED